MRQLSDFRCHPFMLHLNDVNAVEGFCIQLVARWNPGKLEEFWGWSGGKTKRYQRCCLSSGVSCWNQCCRWFSFTSFFQCQLSWRRDPRQGFVWGNVPTCWSIRFEPRSQAQSKTIARYSLYTHYWVFEVVVGQQGALYDRIGMPKFPFDSGDSRAGDGYEV